MRWRNLKGSVIMAIMGLLLWPIFWIEELLKRPRMTWTEFSPELAVLGMIGFVLCICLSLEYTKEEKVEQE